ncbi:MAG: fused MFS/spermidine synthase [Thermoguttaceae bacterium]|nr:fused MFS/spermidine synthase [Thermoguttaceae bacterium]MDW8039339.1 fused MFS/spermidine synthase [Thermoguttaceae bacterium]
MWGVCYRQGAISKPRFFQRVVWLGLAGMLGVLSGAPVEAVSFEATVSVYSGEKVLWETRSPYNYILVTEDAQGLRTLWFERWGARQSVVKPGDPAHVELAYARAMPVGLLLAHRLERVLIVGLGGGTIPSFLRHYYPQLQIDVVELDPEVVKAAKKFFGFKEDQNMRAIVQDGRKYIEQTKLRYDVIFLDAFGAENVPPPLTTREFLQACRQALAPGGLVVGNIWSRASNPLYDSMVRTYQDVFPTLYILDVPESGNRILFALPEKKVIQKADLARRAREESQSRKFRFDMGQPVELGFRLPEDDGLRGRVLLDREMLQPPTSKPQQPRLSPEPVPVR